MKMTFGNMLAAGKSFLNGERATVYHQRTSPFVPVFNGGKNPFASKPATEPEKKAPAPAPESEPAAEQSRVVEAPRKEKSLWPAKFNLFRPAEPKNVFARPVQPELSLESVKPVQNDFAEADIERVPAKSRTVASSGGAWEMLPNAS
jgi:hypothetical protein